MANPWISAKPTLTLTPTLIHSASFTHWSPRWHHCCLSSAPAAMSSHPSIVPRVVFNHVPPRLPWPPWSHEILGPPLLRKMKVDSERKTGSCAHAACNTRHNIMQQNACHALKQILDARKTEERTMHKGLETTSGPPLVSPYLGAGFRDR